MYPLGHTRHQYCLRCGHILDVLSEPRCPECGIGFDPRDPGTYSSRLISGSARLYTATAVAVVAVVYACLMIFVGPVRLGAVGWPLTLLRWAAGVGSYGTAVILAMQGLSILHRRHAAVRGRRALAASVIVGAAVVGLLLLQVAALLIPASRQAITEFWLG